MKSGTETIFNPTQVVVRNFRLIAGYYVCTISLNQSSREIYDEVMIDFNRVVRHHQSLEIEITKESMQAFLRSILKFAVLNLEEFGEISDLCKEVYVSNVREHLEPHNRFVWMQELIEHLDGVRAEEPNYNPDLLLFCISQ